MYPTTQTSDLWLRGSPWVAKILKGAKKIVMLFSKVVSSISMKFGMMEGFRQVLSDFGEFWPTFSESTNF